MPYKPRSRGSSVRLRVVPFGASVSMAALGIKTKEQLPRLSRARRDRSTATPAYLFREQKVSRPQHCGNVGHVLQFCLDGRGYLFAWARDPDYLWSVAHGETIAFGRYVLLRQLRMQGPVEIWLGLQRSAAGVEKLVVIKRLGEAVAQDEQLAA